MNRPAALTSALVATATLHAVSADAAVVFEFDYADASNDAFFSTGTMEGAARRAALADTASYLSSVLSAYTATVSYRVTTFSNDSSTLASAGQNYSFSNSAAGPIRGQVEREILGGESINGNTGRINWNRSQTFYTGADASGIGRTESDFRTVALHELTHSLGWSSLIGNDGSSRFAGSDIYSIYDASLVNEDGTSMVDSGGNYTGGSGALDGPVFFVAADGTRYQTNVSDSAFDPTHLFRTVDSVMNPSITSGTTERSYSDADLAILSGFGYTAIPEPAAAVLLTAGGLTLLGRRRAA